MNGKSLTSVKSLKIFFVGLCQMVVAFVRGFVCSKLDWLYSIDFEPSFRRAACSFIDSARGTLLFVNSSPYVRGVNGVVISLE